MHKPGHLFVVHADLTKLSCDGVLIPCDGDQAISRWWFDLFTDEPERGGPWEPLPQDAALVPGAGPRRFGLVDTVSVGDDLDDLVEAVTSALAGLAQGSLDAHEGRDVPLIAMPLPGTGYGNFAHRRGAIVQTLVPALAHSAHELGVDIALVVRDKRDYAATQTSREHLGELSAEHRTQADRVGELAGAGQLSVFVGAGVSVPLGLPSWVALINQLRRHAGLHEVPNDASDTALKAAASEAANGLGTAYPTQVEQAVEVDHHALSHGLLASLRVAQSVTTNFDIALESAMEVTHGPSLKIIRKDWATSDAPWLLKLHGSAGDPRGVVLTTEEYQEHATRRSPLYGMIEGLLMTSHLLFVGFSLTDSAYLELAGPVAGVYTESNTEGGKVATALGLRSLENRKNALDEAFHHVSFRHGADESSEAAARRLEIFLDRVAWMAARSRLAAYEYLLDRRYEDLVEQLGAARVRDAVEKLHAELRGFTAPVAIRVLQALQEFGGEAPEVLP